MMVFKKRRHRKWKSVGLVETFIAILIFQFEDVAADYCEFGLCDENQYCCGENKCCQKTVEMWYFWAAILLIGIVVLFLVCIFISTRSGQKFRENYLYTIVANTDMDDSVMELP
ncbi:unnamed protein product [Phaedon cochleariae]|uniref:Uncharacterized protein n=1 Tax=Phaedon cochleariae TaxID=80249 RepID=A0A9P0GM83_PHACE|nr:unnamed protein product [Phaedon cochleariae]